MVSGSHCFHRCGHSDITRLLFAMGKLLELYMWNRWPLMSARNLELVKYEMRRVAKGFAEDPHWQIIDTNWNTAMRENNILSIS